VILLTNKLTNADEKHNLLDGGTSLVNILLAMSMN